MHSSPSTYLIHMNVTVYISHYICSIQKNPQDRSSSLDLLVSMLVTFFSFLDVLDPAINLMENSLYSFRVTPSSKSSKTKTLILGSWLVA